MSATLQTATKLRVGVLASGGGTALLGVLAELDALPIELVRVISNREHAPVLERARQRQVPAVWLPAAGLSRVEYDARVSAELEAAGAELVLMVGYMRIVSEEFVARWRGRLLNVHPSLLPAFAGLMDLAVHQAVLDAHATETGCTIHQVTEEVDAGPIVLQRRCAVLGEDTPESLRARVQQLEQQAFVELLRSWPQRPNH